MSDIGDVRIQMPVALLGKTLWFSRYRAVAPWFRFLKQIGVTQLRMHPISRTVHDLPAYVHGAFQGGGDGAAIECVFPSFSSVWALHRPLRPPVQRRRVSLPVTKDLSKVLAAIGANASLVGSTRRPYRLHLRRLVPRSEHFDVPAIEECAAGMRRVLAEAMEWSPRVHDEHFVRKFERALARLNGATEEHGPLRSFELSAEARQLFDAVQIAWCFGGMGWFNDHVAPKEDDEAFRAFLGRLYSALVESWAVAASAGPEPEPPR